MMTSRSQTLTMSSQKGEWHFNNLLLSPFAYIYCHACRYDDIPAEIPDPEATKPEDWDDDEDGEWEPPLIDNPAYKGAWKPKLIPNPEYKGEWVHPYIPNPDYKVDEKLSVRCNDCQYIGFELWQVKSGTIFDDIIGVQFNV